MILEYLEQMRKKPHAVRRRFAFLCASGITLVIALVWGLSLPSQLALLSLSAVDLPEEMTTETMEDSFSENNTQLEEALNPEGMEEALSAFTEENIYAEQGGEIPVDTSAENVRLETTQSQKVYIATTSTERRD